MRVLIDQIHALKRKYFEHRRGQAFLEFALVIPILVLMLLGVIEVAYFIGRYLDVLDLTREAARFASQRDPFDSVIPVDTNCSTPNNFEFYYDTSCVLSPPAGSPTCTSAAWCNGLNPYISLDLARDDVVISSYTVSGRRVTDSHPKLSLGKRNDANTGFYWALSDHDTDTTHNDNWKKDCHNNLVRTEPRFTEPVVDGLLSQNANAQPTKGYVAVEVFYCHQQLLNLPVIVDIIPNPVMIHAYTIMPLPAAQPTATPTTP